MKSADQHIHDWIQEIRVEAMNEISPDRAAYLLTRLSALWGSVNDLAIHAQMTYNAELDRLMGQYDKVTQARIKAQTTDQYRSMLQAEGRVKTTEELIKALKYIIKVKLSELKQSRQEG